MSISIITPHYNDVEGIKRIYEKLSKQTSTQWEWIIIDDCSSIEIQYLLKEFVNTQICSKIRLVLNDENKRASYCRNRGANEAIFEKLLFLDSDDDISIDFVKNRLIHVDDFVVFLNFNCINDKGGNFPFSNIKSDFLDNFLQAKFAWQTTAVLWNKYFFNKIGGFDGNLPLLEDIEISIRGLLMSEEYRVDTNCDVDFYYFVKPIDIKKRNVEKVCKSVDYFVKSITSKFELDRKKTQLLKGYYFLCTRYLCKSNDINDVQFVKSSLTIFYSAKCISLRELFLAQFLLHLYKRKMITNTFFLKINRYFFK